jgi:hypothetical protein
VSDPIRLSVGQIYDQYARSILDKKDLFVDAPSYDALAASLNAALQDRNDECRLRQGAEKRYAEGFDRIVTLAADRDSHQREAIRLLTRIRDLEAALRKYGGHRVICAYVDREAPCDCGWEVALSGARTATDTEGVEP